MPQRYSGIFTWSKLAHPSWSTEIAVRRYTSLSWNATGPSSFHHSMNFGCHDSSARWSRRSPARPLALVLDQHVLAVEEQDVEFLDLVVRDLRVAIIDQLVP